MPDRAPRAVEVVERRFGGRDDRFPRRGAGVLRHALDDAARLRKQRVDRGHDIRSADAIEAGQAGEVEERVIVRRAHVENGVGVNFASSAARSAGVPTFAHGPS